MCVLVRAYQTNEVRVHVRVRVRMRVRVHVPMRVPDVGRGEEKRSP